MIEGGHFAEGLAIRIRGLLVLTLENVDLDELMGKPFSCSASRTERVYVLIAGP